MAFQGGGLTASAVSLALPLHEPCHESVTDTSPYGVKWLVHRVAGVASLSQGRRNIHRFADVLFRFRWFVVEGF